MKQDWVIIVPIKDQNGNIVDWRPKGIIPSATLHDALTIARREYGADADVRERYGKVR